MTAPPDLRTPRLALTPIAPADAGRVEQIAAHPDVVSMTISVPQPMTVNLATDWIARQRQAIEAGTAVTYLARLGRDGPGLGVVALHHIDLVHRCAELSFWFGSEARGCGYASESAAALVQHGFDEIGLHRIEAYHMVWNIPSERLLERVGFRFEGILRERVIKGSVRHDVKLWARLRTDTLGEAARALKGSSAHEQFRGT